VVRSCALFVLAAALSSPALGAPRGHRVVLADPDPELRHAMDQSLAPYHLLQDTFIEIFRALGSFRGDSTLGRWCQIIAVRVAYLAISRRHPPAVELALVEDTVAGDADLRRHVQVREAVDRHDARAATLLGRYLQRFPGGANAADARGLLSRLHADRP